MKAQRFNIAIRLNTQKPKNDQYPIYLRVFVDGSKFELSTKIYLPESHWDSKKAKVRPSVSNSHYLNGCLDNLCSRLHSIFLDLTTGGQKTTVQAIKNRYLGIEDKCKENTLMDAFEYHEIKMKELVKVGKVVMATFKRYEITKNKVVAFLDHQYKISDIELPKVKLRFITEFEHYMLTEEKIQSNTAHKYIKNLKKIMNMSVGLDWIPNNPFNLFKCSYIAPEREILSLEELLVLRNKEISNPRLSEVRDVFVFCCYTGFAYGDIYLFEKDAVMKGMDGELWLATNRQKTGTRESVPLLPAAVEILENYQEHEYCIKYNKLLPVNSNQKFNAYLTEIAVICNINKHLTSHIARHTFATTVTLANGVPIETVSAMLGHNSIRTTQIYAKVVQKKVSEDMLLLKRKLFSNTPTKELKMG